MSRNPNMEITRNHARAYGIEAQRTGESDYNFRYRVAGVLRGRGLVIEAHEALNGSLYDEKDAGGERVVTGLTGLMSMALHGREYSRDPEHQLDDEYAAGALVLHSRPDPPAEAMLLAIELSDAGRRGRRTQPNHGGMRRESSKTGRPSDRKPTE